MKTNLSIIHAWLLTLVVFGLVPADTTARAQGTAFTYQGRLNSGGGLAGGSYDLAFTVYDTNAPAGNWIAGPVTNAAVAVSNGLFTVTLDFGAGVFTGGPRWLEIAVRTNGSAGFTMLTPRQPITPSPYAVMAGSASNLSGTLPVGQVNGVVPLAQLPAVVLTNYAMNISLSGFFTGNFGGTFFGNGAGLSGLLPANLSAGTAAINISGNAATATTAVTATNLIGNVADAQLSTNIARLNGTNNFTGTNIFAGVVIATNVNNVIAGIFTGNGGGLTNLNTAQFANLVLTNGETGVTLTGNFIGNGGGLTNLSASQLTSGTVADARLSGNVALLNGTQTFTGSNTFVLGNFNGAFAGNGTAVTNVNLLSVNTDGAIIWTTTNGGGFSLTSTPFVGGYPASLVAADVNGDGRPDLICSIQSSNAVVVLTNNGSGGFALATTLSVAFPLSVTAADVNGDGRPDLISVGNYTGTTTTISIWTNNGSGNFALSSTLTVTGNPHSVAMADVNGDGKVDMVCAYGTASYYTNFVSVFTNNGSGNFTLAENLTVANGSSPYSATVADVNGDGWPDLITVNFGNNTLSVFTNIGGSGFAIASTIPIGVFTEPVLVVAADVNGDGKMDLVSANSFTNTLSVFTNIGGGNFAFSANLTVGAYPDSVAAADVNGDGKVDLISANDNVAGTLTVMINNGSGGFMLYSNLNVGARPISVVAADVNGDGKVDLVSANNGDGTLSVLLNAPSTANFVGNGSGLTGLNASQLANGSITLTQLPTSLVTNGASGVTLAGSFTGNGSGLTGLNTTQLSGVMTLAQLPSSLVTNGESGVNLTGSFSGSFSGNGANVSNVNAAALNGLNATNFWQTGGNTGTSPANGNYLGTADGQPLDLRANGSRVLRLQPDFSGEGSPNVIGGASSNTASGFGATIGGGGASSFNAFGNRYAFPNTVNGSYGTVAGGFNNSASYAAVVSGGWSNVATNSYATVPGGIGNVAGGEYSFAAGQSAQALHQGTFVWADSQVATFSSTSSNQFLIRAGGNVGINTTNPGATLHVVNGSSGVAAPNSSSVGAFESSGSAYINLLTPAANESGLLFGNTNSTADGGILYNSGSLARGLEFRAGGNNNRMVITSAGNVGIGTTSPGYLLVVGSSGSPAYCNGTTWQNGSDRNIKQDFGAISPQEVLAKVSALPITKWQYKVEDADTKHIGPMAQDFHAAFGLNGNDDKHISTVDEGGVALAAIQGLNQKVETGSQNSEARIQKLETENAELKQQLADLKVLVERLASTPAK